ncbi:alpha/beta hydrolase [Brevibacillus porteri]|uniref:alpha/beta hydrolase n=1 Tax=Brevibacillus TaxID=55080 RepID=UPI000852A5A9|nr:MULTISPECIES: alpha/beta hydrolase [Brevibacillus]NTU24006.1 alpha/beta hydrolase [Brevibacillus sp. HB1.2]NTU34045.1 alpha/beta hydrolase [Brevibacillus sp. HB1.1]
MNLKHIFRKGTDSEAPTLLLLHGTGGDENDLLPLANRIYPGASVLSVRGNVLENGMPRFFRRLAEGVFDEEDLVYRTQELHDFLDQAAVTYQIERDNIVAVGYSNGANIAGSLLFHYPNPLKGAILYHPMVPRRGIALPDMSAIPVFIGAGTNDPICTAQETEELNRLLTEAGADVTVHWDSYGHQLTVKEVEASAAWFTEMFRK